MKTRSWVIALTLLGWLILPNQQINAQALPPAGNQLSIDNDTINTLLWVDMWHDPNSNYYDVVRAFELYWSANAVPKGGGRKQFKRWEYANQDRIDENGYLQSPAEVLGEYKAFAQQSSSSNPNFMMDTWTELGPAILPTNGTSQPNG